MSAAPPVRTHSSRPNTAHNSTRLPLIRTLDQLLHHLLNTQHAWKHVETRLQQVMTEASP